MSIKDGPGEGTWSVFAQKVVEQRDDAREEAANLRKTIEGVSRSLAAVSNGWPYEHEPVLHVSQALKLACDTIDALRRNNQHMRHALEDIREWAKHDDVIRFDDGDIPLADYCARALHGGK